MTTAQYKALTDFILSWEGGYVNDPDDRGGATNKGITLATFRTAYGQAKTITDLKALTPQQWDYIFRRYYFNPLHPEQIADPNIINLLTDWAWASGTTNIIKKTQALLGTPADGIVGPKTLNLINNREAAALFDILKNRRKKFLNDICTTHPTNRKFLNGWLRRLACITYGKLTLNGGKERII